MPELPINSGASAVRMAEEMFGDGVTVVGASFTGDARASGIWNNGFRQSPGVVPSDTGVILTTGRTRDFSNVRGQANQSADTSTDNRGVDNDADFNALAGTNTFDASWIDVDFIPEDDVLTMQFVFLSEEYPEFSNTIFNDIVGVWVNTVPVPLAVGDGTTSVDNINQVDNVNLFVANATSGFNTEMDGFTVTMTLKMRVVPDEVNSVRIGIADVSDARYDSALLIKSGSLQTVLIANDDTITVNPGASRTFDLTANDDGPGNSALFITHLNGQAVVAGQSVTLATGEVLTLNADGTVTVTGDTDLSPMSTNFTYTVATGGGNSQISDTAFVTLNTIPCFVAGTRIRTPAGQVRVEALRPGDLMVTRDEGPRPVRWVGRRVVAAEGAMAPIRIAADALGRHRTLMVSPLHRILIADQMAELLFGEREVLVAARDLVNGDTIRPVEGGTVEYVHILFDRHQVVFSEGLATESFLPGPQTTSCFAAALVDEIRAIFPELDPVTGQGYSPAARRTLKPFEARLIAGRVAAA